MYVRSFGIEDFRLSIYDEHNAFVSSPWLDPHGGLDGSCVTSRCFISLKPHKPSLEVALEFWQSVWPASVNQGPGRVLVYKAVLRWLSANLRSSSPYQEIIEDAIGAPMTELIDQHIHLTILHNIGACVLM